MRADVSSGSNLRTEADETRRDLSLVFHCAQCNKPATSTCARCKSARYCGAACQREHWAIHKGTCRLDAAVQPPPETELRIDHKCRHGGPLPDGKVIPVIIALHGLLVTASGAKDARAALDDLARFAAAEPAIATNSAAPKVLYSMAVDALVDANGGTARTFVRLGAFCSHYAAGGGKFLEQLCAGSGEAAPLADAFLSDLRDAESRAGLLALLAARCRAAGCKCLGKKG